MPNTYRLIPYTIEAEPVEPETSQQVALWCGGMIASEIDPRNPAKRYVAINVATLSGVKRASEGDYIIKWPQGGFTVMRKAQFEATYERAKKPHE